MNQEGNMKINIELTQEQINIIGWGLLVLVGDSRPEDFQEDKKQATDIMKKINPSVIYEFRSIDV